LSNVRAECRFTFGGAHVSKEIARIYYMKTELSREVEISPVFLIDIDISKSIVVKLAHKEYVECVEQANAS